MLVCSNREFTAELNPVPLAASYHHIHSAAVYHKTTW